MEGLLNEKVRIVIEGVMGPSPSEILGRTCSLFMNIVGSFSQEGAFLIYLFGLKLGEKLGMELKNYEDDLWDVLPEVLKCMGLARGTHFLAKSYDRIAIRIEFPGEYRGKLLSCSFLRGVVTGFLSGITGRYFSGREANCSEEGLNLELREMQGDECIDPRRRTIMEYLRVNPGAHMRKIARDLDMSLGSLRWHLNVLERKGLIFERKKGNLTEFYLSELKGMGDHQSSSSQGTS